MYTYYTTNVNFYTVSIDIFPMLPILFLSVRMIGQIEYFSSCYCIASDNGAKYGDMVDEEEHFTLTDVSEKAAVLIPVEK